MNVFAIFLIHKSQTISLQYIHHWPNLTTMKCRLRIINEKLFFSKHLNKLEEIGCENLPIVICRYRQILSYFWRYFADIGKFLRTFQFFADRKHFSKKLKMDENFNIISHLFKSFISSYFRYISDLIWIYFLYFYFIFLFMNYIIDWWNFKNGGYLKELKIETEW